MHTSKIGVSICITTYNHEKYIDECLNSVLNQDFNQDFEIIVCNDNSKDKTEEKILNLIGNHPKGNIIRYSKNIPNLGYVKNTLHSFSLAKGKYIAILDGDDYWIDKNKLQKQFDFLENNTDFSASGTDSLVIYEDADKKSHGFSYHQNRELDKEDLTDLKICQTSTFFFRKDILREDFPTDIISADRCLYLLAGCFGKVKIFPEQTSTYRQFESSLSKKVTYENMLKDFAVVPFIIKYNPAYSNNKLKSYFFYTLMSYPTKITKTQFKKASSCFLYYDFMSKISLNPFKNLMTIKWGMRTIKQKRQFHEIRGFI